MPQGTLFTEDFLNEGIRGTDAWRGVTPEIVASFREALQATVKKVADPARLNEAQTEERIVKPILETLGWNACYWVQERLETKGRANVPDYLSPMVRRLADVWARIRAEAEQHGWLVRDDQLADRNLIKRFVLKRCVYGVDKNPMAVELAKVALWLHTFTAGAPLSFLDHHLKCGDSLYGEWVRKALDELAARGTLMISDAVRSAEASIAGMALVESRSDADIAEVKQSAADYHGVEAKTEPLRRFLNFWQAIKWLDLSAEEKKALQALFDGHFGQPLPIAAALTPPNPPAGLGNGEAALFGDAGQQLALAGTGVASAQDYLALKSLLGKAHALAGEQRFLHWQIAFPGVWKNWTSAEPDGGFDAVIGNPPWDKIEVDEITWFRSHDSRFAGLAKVKKSELRKTIDREKKSGSIIWADFEEARERSKRAVELARRSGDYAGTSKGRADLSALFVERGQHLLSRRGREGLLVPTGMVANSRLAPYFNQMCSKNQVANIVDFENRLGLTCH